MEWTCCSLGLMPMEERVKATSEGLIIPSPSWSNVAKATLIAVVVCGWVWRCVVVGHCVWFHVVVCDCVF